MPLYYLSLSKQYRLSFPTHIPSSQDCFDLLHVDIWGPSTISTLDGCKYFLSILDDYSKFTWIFY